MSRHFQRRAFATHLRQVSRGSPDRSTLSFQRGRSPDSQSQASTTAHSANGRAKLLARRCTVTVNETYSPDEVLLNFDLVGSEIKSGQLMSMAVVTEKDREGGEKGKGDGGSRKTPGLGDNEILGKKYTFVAKDFPLDFKAKHPNVEVYVVKQIADNFGMKKGTSVLLSHIDSSNPVVEASFVELTFRDQYLSRSDMWRMAVDELTGRTIYRGQSVLFMGTIKAIVSSIFVGDAKAHSAFFTRATRPVFRSESARYVIFIQMAREMWDFDAEGSGEIMFNKVVNGLLPALFKKWALLKAHHRVSIVLFARVEYDFGLSDQFVSGELGSYYTGVQPSGLRRPYKDFYRVVVSEMSSGEWTTILYQLKKEFNYFRRDISTFHLTAPGVISSKNLTEDEVRTTLNQIKAESSLAMYGNFLEAIAIASSMFATDYIDRDLNHTGVSLVIISPGPGVFEVEYETLRKTTESLIGNGLGIDLVCVPKLPLHSVPLFRYRTRQFLQDGKERWIRSRESTPRGGQTSIVGSYASAAESVSPSKTVTAGSSHMRRNDSFASTTFGTSEEWSYAVPQWLHVAFWTGTSEEALSYQGIVLAVAGSNDENEGSKKRKQLEDDFVIRCRMYGLQMRSVLETNEIETAPLAQDPAFHRSLMEFTLTGREHGKLKRVGDHHFYISRTKPYNPLGQNVIGMREFRPEKPPTRTSKRDYRKQFQLLMKYDNQKAKLPARRTPALGGRYYNRDLGAHADSTGTLGTLGTSIPENQETPKNSGLSRSGRKMSITLSDMDRPGRRRGSMAASAFSSIGSQPISSLTHSKTTESHGRNRSPVASTSTSGSLGPLGMGSRLGSFVKAPKLMRGISLGTHGFGIAAPKASVAAPSLDPVVAVNTAGPQRALPDVTAASTISRALPVRPSPTPSVMSLRKEPLTAAATGTSSSSIPIRNSGSGSVTSLQQLHAEALAAATPRPGIFRTGSSVFGRDRSNGDPEVAISDQMRKDEAKVNKMKLKGGWPSLHHSGNGMQDMSSSPGNNQSGPYGEGRHRATATVSPWLMMLNPSNPDVSKIDDATRYRSWQHVFPGTSRMRVMKWKTLCCPAAVPLTTEYFPTQKEFETDWQCVPYSIAQNGDDEFTHEDTKSRQDFLRELIALRFSQGFQVVIGPAVARAFGQKMFKVADIFSRESGVEDGTSIFMSSGNSIHQLSCSNGTEIEVNIYTRKLDPTVYSSSLPEVYRPAIRTLLDHEYEQRQMNIFSHRHDYNWNQIDSYIAGQMEEMTDVLRFWRARFVLIPMVGRLSNQEKQSHEYNNEEIQLEGIKKLAQLWQRHRVVAASERPLMPFGPSRRRRDPNPLDIVYKTEDPSMVVAMEHEADPLFEGPEGPRRGHLVSRRDGFRKASINIAALAEAIQQPADQGGVKMQTRKWHLHSHENCFIGSDMTTWLLDNFDDLETREDAEALGNRLMMAKASKETEDSSRSHPHGLFLHVQNRHPFRDGQYFYRIVPEFAKPAAPPISHNWFKRKDRDIPSVPATPQIGAIGMDRERSTTTSHAHDDSPSRPASVTTPTQSSAGGFPLPLSTSRGKQRAKTKPIVMLSKVIKYDVDHRKRSYRPERINLHYDRLHNPDSCYHIRIDWLNTTPKLIEDAIDGWAREAANHGLRLVEVPIDEASAITTQNPFRRPYLIKVLPPPDYLEHAKVNDSRASIDSFSTASPAQTPRFGAMRLGFQSQAAAPPQPQRHRGSHRFPFQKEVLHRFDFVLDVEAADNFPSNVDVRYSWGSPDYRYSQYIHRSGCVLAQITTDGDFLILENHLFSNRGATKEKSLAADRERGGAAHAHLQHLSTHSGPIDSPRLKPTFRNSPAVGPVVTSKNSKATAETATSLNQLMFDRVMAELETFCSDGDAMEAFYHDVVCEQKLAESPGSDSFASIETTAVAAATHVENRASMWDKDKEIRGSRDSMARKALEAVPDANIPSLGLPPNVLDLASLPNGGGLGMPLESVKKDGTGKQGQVVTAMGGLATSMGMGLGLGMNMLRRGSVQVDGVKKAGEKE